MYSANSLMLPVYLRKPHTRTRKICGQATHDDCHIHIVDKLGVHYVRKTLVRSGDREIAVYKHLLHYQFEDHYPGIQHFIYTWSTGYWKHNGAQYLELPYFLPVGDELRKEQGSCLQGMSLSLCDQLLTAVNFLHSVVKVAHMDIKPDNLVLDAGETLKVIDFNLSIMDATCDVPPGRCGTKGYMAPEVEGPGLYSPVLADLYSCGICMDDFLDMDQRTETKLGED
ncbi:kinase-like protein [Gymnopus androsaceus JB14]|uniref:Kinase-like protein n=1 Tax=Gymnopus androsaceus JB14 TaxID=1447944 RepID=A0A6A4HK48_9AGAR|nr:kinase-like protein [Gymnopus androsaceus JB14]